MRRQRTKLYSAVPSKAVPKSRRTPVKYIQPTQSIKPIDFARPHQPIRPGQFDLDLDPPEGVVETVGDWVIRKRFVFLKGMILLGISAVVSVMALTMSQTAARMLPGLARQRQPVQAAEASSLLAQPDDSEPAAEVAVIAIEPLLEPTPRPTSPAQVPPPPPPVIIQEVITVEVVVEDPPLPLPANLPSVAKPRATNANPGRLLIPELEIDTDVEKLGLVDNSWDVQSLGMGVGLLESTGRYPGDDFSMVFAGHVSTRWTFWGPFAKLGQLEEGTEIIYQWDGHDYTYEITGRQRIWPSDGELLFRQEEGTILLLTCIGYDHTTGDYVERLLVEAKLSEEPVESK